MRRTLLTLLFILGISACGGAPYSESSYSADRSPENQSAHADDAANDVVAMACSDCPWLFVRCMSRATTPEAKASCEESRLLCEETFCTYGAAGANVE